MNRFCHGGYDVRRVITRFAEDIFSALLLLALLLAGATRAAEGLDQPSLRMRGGGTGTLKICSKPLECEVMFRGQMLKKDRAVLTVSDVQPGLHEVVFISGGTQVVKKARVMPGETTIIFGALDGAEAARPSVAEALPVARPAAFAGAGVGAGGGAAASTGVAQAPVRGGLALEDSRMVIAAAPAAAPAVAPMARGSGGYDQNAEITYELAELLREPFNPFTASRRYQRSLTLYQRIIDEFPQSTRVEMAHYNIGRICESRHIKQYEKALAEYRAVLQMNPYTQTDAAARIAKLYSGPLKNLARADMQSVPELQSVSLEPLQPAFTPVSGASGGEGLNAGNIRVVERAPTDAAGIVLE